MDLSLSGQSRDAEGRRPAAHPGLGPWVGARVASPRCPILRPGPSSLLPSTATTQFRVGSPPTRRTLNDSVNRSQGSKSRLAIPPPSSLGGISPGKYPLGPMVLPPHRQPYGGPAMRDIAFFSRLLALEKPWRVERVSLEPQASLHRHPTRPSSQRVFLLSRVRLPVRALRPRPLAELEAPRSRRLPDLAPRADPPG